MNFLSASASLCLRCESVVEFTKLKMTLRVPDPRTRTPCEDESYSSLHDSIPELTREANDRKIEMRPEEAHGEYEARVIKATPKKKTANIGLKSRPMDGNKTKRSREAMVVFAKTFAVPS